MLRVRGGLRQISSGLPFDSYESLDFSPDGKQLLGRAVPPGATTGEIWRLDAYHGAAEGGFAIPVTGSFTGSPFYPEWAPRPSRR